MSSKHPVAKRRQHIAVGVSPFEQPYDKWRGCKYALELTRWEKRFGSYDGSVEVTSRELGRVTGLKFSGDAIFDEHLLQLVEFKEDLQYVRKLEFEYTNVDDALISFDYMWRLEFGPTSRY